MCSLSILSYIIFGVLFFLGTCAIIFAWRFFRAVEVKYPIEIVGKFVRKKSSDDPDVKRDAMLFVPDINSSANIIGELWQYPNRNVMITGMAGLSAKTTLAEVLVDELSDENLCKKYGFIKPIPCVIFSPKKFEDNTPVDFMLGNRFRLVDCSKEMINVFENRNAFIASWRVLVLNSMESKGITASVIAEMTGEILDEGPCLSWANFEQNLEKVQRKKRDDKIALSQLNWISTQTHYLAIKATVSDIPLANVIFYFGNLEKVRAFYYEMYLEKLSDELLNSKIQPVVVCDEAHIILKQEGGVIATILREMRTHCSAVFAISQNLDDVDPALWQFAKIFCGTTQHLEPFEKKPTLNECISKIPPYHYVDFTYRGTDNIPVYAISEKTIARIKTLKEEGLKYLNSVVVAPVDDLPDVAGAPFKDLSQRGGGIMQQVAKEKPVVVASESKEEIEKKIVDVLEKNEYCMYYSDVCSELGFRKKADDLKRLDVNKLLKQMVKAKEILEKYYITATMKEGQKARHYYFSVPDGESKLHRTLKRDVISVLDKVGMKFEEGKINQGYDIYIPNREKPNVVVECETSLKHSLKEYDEKVNASSVFVITVCCNLQDADRFSYLTCVSAGKTKIVLLNQLADALKAEAKA